MKPAVSLASRSCRAVAPVEPAAAAIASRPTHTALPLRADPAYPDTMSWNDDDLGPDASGWSEEPAQLWTPTRTNQEIAGRMRDLRGLRVRGEVSQPRASSGHLYFELKDERSRLRAVIWRSTMQRQRIELRDGDQVVCTGDLDVWVQGGTYSLVVSKVEQAGIGALWAALQRLREQLQAEGLFDAERKKPLPALPGTVGIVTAAGGAALRDMLRVLHDRYPVRVIVAPAKVQGPGAGASVADALGRLDRSGLCDVIIVGRGGGSIEDLWAFHEEVVARAIAACMTPVVSAVGHESDTLLSDHVADVRAPTPTAAAEMVVPRLVDLLARLEELQRRALGSVRRLLLRDRREWSLLASRLSGDRLTAERAAQLDQLRRRLAGAALAGTTRRRRRVDALRLRLERADPRRRLAAGRLGLQRLLGRLAAAAPLQDGRARRRLARLDSRLLAVGGGDRLLARHRQRLAVLQARLHALDPRLALQRGFAIVRDPGSGALLHDAADTATGAQLQVILARGELQVDVVRVVPAAEPR